MLFGVKLFHESDADSIRHRGTCSHFLQMTGHGGGALRV